ADVHYLQPSCVFETPFLVDIKHNCSPIPRLARDIQSAQAARAASGGKIAGPDISTRCRPYRRHLFGKG
ncbi:hypothetical protein, partial [Pantoea agglomerans]|uniref:hypothetical protein n=1 Tax=Enterobacter agglomerans TaxID=549 RepID=UPI001A925330